MPENGIQPQFNSSPRERCLEALAWVDRVIDAEKVEFIAGYRSKGKAISPRLGLALDSLAHRMDAYFGPMPPRRWDPGYPIEGDE